MTHMLKCYSLHSFEYECIYWSDLNECVMVKGCLWYIYGVVFRCQSYDIDIIIVILSCCAGQMRHREESTVSEPECDHWPESPEPREPPLWPDTCWSPVLCQTPAQQQCNREGGLSFEIETGKCQHVSRSQQVKRNIHIWYIWYINMMWIL